METIKFLPYYLGAILMGTACQNTDEPSEVTESLHSVSIHANIGNLKNAGRYAQETDSSIAQFQEGDKIGLFMDNAPAVCWTYSSIAWAPATPMIWPDNAQKHTFYAYYPYEQPETDLKAVRMPSLKDQSGKFSDISKHDFLVATKTTAYNDYSGVVSFSGNEAFQHVSTLLKINFKPTGFTKGITIHQITLQGGDLFSPCSYSFEKQMAVVAPSGAGNSLTISPEQVVDTQEVPIYFVVNGTKHASSNSASVTMTIKYSTQTGKSFTAQKQGFINQLNAGNIYKFNVQVAGTQINITGTEISNWTPGNGEGENITISGESISSL